MPRIMDTENHLISLHWREFIDFFRDYRFMGPVFSITIGLFIAAKSLVNSEEVTEIVGVPTLAVQITPLISAIFIFCVWCIGVIFFKGLAPESSKNYKNAAEYYEAKTKGIDHIHDKDYRRAEIIIEWNTANRMPIPSTIFALTLYVVFALSAIAALLSFFLLSYGLVHNHIPF